MSDLALRSLVVVVISFNIGLLTRYGFFVADPGNSGIFACCGNQPSVFDCTGRNAEGSTGSTIVGGTGLAVNGIIIGFDKGIRTPVILYIGIHEFRC